MAPRLTAICVLAAALGGASATAGGLDEALYAKLLDEHTRDVRDLARVRVDYAALAASEDWRRVVASLDDAEAGRFSREERLAFWINAYNILAIDLVARNLPLDGIKDIGSLFSPVWKKPAGRAAGAERTLHEIEHEILRPMGEPRIHAAIVCASLSCPPLRREPWRASDLQDQLDDQMRRFLSDPEKGLRLDAARRTLYLSRIFDWFEEDFAKSGGVLAYAQKYSPEPARSWIAQNGTNASIRYLDYDWSLNQLR